MMEQIKCSYDISVTSGGLSGGTDFSATISNGSAGPSSGPRSCALRTLAHQRRIDRLAATLGNAGWAQLRYVVLDNHGLPAYCALNINAAGRPLNRQVALGTLMAVLTRVVEWADDNPERQAAHA